METLGICYLLCLDGKSAHLFEQDCFNNTDSKSCRQESQSEVVPGLAAASLGAGLGKPLFPCQHLADHPSQAPPALQGTSSRPREPPRGGQHFSFPWPLKITCARCETCLGMSSVGSAQPKLGLAPHHRYTSSRSGF